jgi:multiple sugar transport system substrate-binding protein
MREEPDIFEARSADIARWGRGNRLLPLTELPGLEEFLAEKTPYQEENETYIDGKIFSVMHHRQFYGLAYNKRLLSRSGFEKPPSSWAEFEKACAAISALGPFRAFGFAIPLSYIDYPRDCVEFFAFPAIGRFIYDGKNDQYDIMRFLPFFQMILRIKEAGALYPGMESLTESAMYAQFAEGRIGFIPVDMRCLGLLSGIFPSAVDWDIMPFPVMDAGVQHPGVYYNTPAFVVSAKVKERGLEAESAEVFKLLSDDEILRLLYRGGTDFPLRPGIIAAEKAPSRKQFQSFLNLYPVTVKARRPHAEPDYREVFTDILTGKADPRDALEGLERRLNAAKR